MEGCDPRDALLRSQPAPRAHVASTYRVLETGNPPADAKRCLELLLDAVDEALPVPKNRAHGVARAVRELWTSLTSERSARSADYMRTPETLSAYARYFMPWNVVRLVPLLFQLRIDLPDNAVLVDLGSGPFTLPIALWIARPELRTRSIKLVCVDRVSKAMEAGEAILDVLALKVAGQKLAWQVEIKRDVIGRKRSPSDLPKADLLTAVNVFTETFWQDRRPVREKAVEYVADLDELRKEGGRALVVEPGEPRSGAFIAALREAFILSGSDPAAPCPHARSCPVSGVFRGFATDDEGNPRSSLPPVHRPRRRAKMPWCHFVCELDIAPPRLHALSERAGLPKDRLTLSYLHVNPIRRDEAKLPREPSNHLPVRLISDAIRIPMLGTGRYACSEKGYSLVTGPAAEEASGRLVELAAPRGLDRDEKSGAVLFVS